MLCLTLIRTLGNDPLVTRTYTISLESIGIRGRGINNIILIYIGNNMSTTNYSIQCINTSIIQEQLAQAALLAYIARLNDIEVDLWY